MKKLFISKNKAKALSLGLFIVGLAIMFLSAKWWPGIMLVIGLPLALKQFLNSRHYDAFISLFIFVGFFIITNFNINWKVLVPVLFILSAIYTLCREWVVSFYDEDVKTNDL